MLQRRFQLATEAAVLVGRQRVPAADHTPLPSQRSTLPLIVPEPGVPYTCPQARCAQHLPQPSHVGRPHLLRVHIAASSVTVHLPTQTVMYTYTHTCSTGGLMGLQPSFVVHLTCICGSHLLGGGVAGVFMVINNNVHVGYVQGPQHVPAVHRSRKVRLVSTSTPRSGTKLYFSSLGQVQVLVGQPVYHL